jgi:hypothetical protein
MCVIGALAAPGMASARSSVAQQSPPPGVLISQNASEDTGIQSAPLPQLSSPSGEADGPESVGESAPADQQLDWTADPLESPTSVKEISAPIGPSR